MEVLYPCILMLTWLGGLFLGYLCLLTIGKLVCISVVTKNFQKTVWFLLVTEVYTAEKEKSPFLSNFPLLHGVPFPTVG